MKSQSIFYWYNVLKSHYHLTTFNAIRYAMWLAR